MKQKYFYIICLSLLSFPNFNANAARLSVLFSGSSSGVTFSGYAGPFDGNLGGIKGVNQKCAAAFTGSRMCTYDDILRLGSNYTYANTVWFIDSVTGSDGGSVVAKTGYYNGGSAGNGTCVQWASNNSAYYGFVLQTTGVATYVQCSSTQYLACCK